MHTHPDTHTHPHDHLHTDSHEHPLAHLHSDTGIVHRHPHEAAQPAVLEIGGDIGAAVIYATAELDGAEIDIKTSDGDWDGTHTAVRRRPRGDGQEATYAALYFGLTEGSYDLRLGEDIRHIQVVGGAVTEETW